MIIALLKTHIGSHSQLSSIRFNITL